jgi:hypothetical protein
MLESQIDQRKMSASSNFHAHNMEWPPIFWSAKILIVTLASKVFNFRAMRQPHGIEARARQIS